MLATVNMVGGFVVTDRMLQMFKGRRPATRRTPRGSRRERPVADLDALVYLALRVCFILALKGLSSPETARSGNLIGAGRCGARGARGVPVRPTCTTCR